MKKIIVLVETQEQFDLAIKVLGDHPDFDISYDHTSIHRRKNGESYGYWLEKEQYWERKRAANHE